MSEMDKIKKIIVGGVQLNTAVDMLVCNIEMPEELRVILQNLSQDFQAAVDDFFGEGVCAAMMREILGCIAMMAFLLTLLAMNIVIPAQPGMHSESVYAAAAR